MRTLTADETFLYGLEDYDVALRVRVEDGDGSLVDLTDLWDEDWVVAAEWGENVDDNVADATVQLRRAINDLSLATLHETSPFNQNAAGSYDALLKVGREIVIDIEIIAESTDGTATWTEMFRGVIDDVTWGTDPITVQARDQGQVLQDTWIETEDTYSSLSGSPLETEIQQILDDTLGAAVVTLYTPTSPSWNITRFASQKQSLMDQITLLTEQIGWRVAYLWDSGTSAFRFTLYEIDRTKTTPDYTFSDFQILDISRAAESLDEVRNAITVGYTSGSSTEADGTPSELYVTVTDATSISEFGRRWMGINEDASSNIDTNAEALRMANAALSDLKDPSSDYSSIHRLIHFVELGDLYTFPANGVHWTSATDLSVVAFRHRMSDDELITTLTLRDAPPAGKVGSWLQSGSGPGIASLQDELGPTVGTVTLGTYEGGVYASVAGERSKPTRYELHMGDPGFTPDTLFPSTTLVAISDGQDLHIPGDSAFNPIGESRGLVVYPIDERGNRGTPSAEVTAAATRYGSQFLHDAGRWGRNFGGVFGVQSRGPNYPADYWDMSSGIWGTDADLDTGSTYAAPKTGATGLLLANTATATAVDSDKQPVTPGRRYRVEGEWKADSVAAGRTVTVEVRWLDSTESLISTETIISKVADAADTFEPISAQMAPPPTARFAEMRVRKAAFAYQVLVDRLLWEETEQAVVPSHGYGGLSLFDDFPADGDGQSIGSLPWLSTSIAGGPLTLSKPAPTALGANWTVFGIQRLTVRGAGAVYKGGTISLGTASSPPTRGVPPVGVEYRPKVRLPDNLDTLTAWHGVWSSETTWPDSGGTNTVSGIGIRTETTGAGATNWLGVVRNGTTETTVDLGVLADSNWRYVGWRKTGSGVQFTVAGEDVGSEVTTNLPLSTDPMIPMFGIVADGGLDRDFDVDQFGLFGSMRRD